MGLTASEPADHRREILLIGHTAARPASRCEHCGERNAFWRLRDGDGAERDLCPYCAALESEAS